MKAGHIVNVLLEEEPIDPDTPASARSELNRLFPTRIVRFGGNSMLYAPGIISAAQHEYRSKSKKQRAWAENLLRSWPGLSDEEYAAILMGQADVVPDGDSAIVTIKLWKK